MAFLKSKASIFAIIVFIVGFLSAIGFVKGYVYADGPLEEETLFVVSKGFSLNPISEPLMYYNIISLDGYRWDLFKVTYYLFFNGKSIKAGEYSFPPHISPYAVLTKLTTGDIYYHKLTIAEGLMTFEVLKRIEEAEGLTGDVPGDVDEGELLPETYLYTYGESRKELVLRMYEKQLQTLEALWSGRVTGLPIKNKKEAIILASIVEKETGRPEERGLVASVYINRLNKGIKLQADPTIIYAITQGKKILHRDLNNKDLKINSPYNTYRYKGLPPGPICNPGAESIKAVLHPEDSGFLYFVADGNGGHNFAQDINQHNRNVRLYRLQKRRDKSASPKN